MRGDVFSKRINGIAFRFVALNMGRSDLSEEVSTVKASLELSLRVLEILLKFLIEELCYELVFSVSKAVQDFCIDFSRDSRKGLAAEEIHVDFKFDDGFDVDSNVIYAFLLKGLDLKKISRDQKHNYILKIQLKGNSRG
jgi:hypothetical protein